MHPRIKRAISANEKSSSVFRIFCYGRIKTASLRKILSAGQRSAGDI
jgi:hypothetical protein